MAFIIQSTVHPYSEGLRPSSGLPSSLRRFVPIQLSILLITGGLLLAQEFRGTITGSVQDPSGGVIPGAGVSVTHIETGQTTKRVTNDSGQYVAALLIPGTYRLEVEMSGFKKFLRNGMNPRESR